MFLKCFLFLVLIGYLILPSQGDCVSLELTPSSRSLLYTAASSDSLMIRMRLNIVETTPATSLVSHPQWVAVQSTSLLNILPAARFYTDGAIATAFSFITLNLTGTSCSSFPSPADQQLAIWTALNSPISDLGYTFCNSRDLTDYQCCSHVATENGNATCIGFNELTVALFPLTLQVMITGGLGCYIFFYAVSALQRWNYYGIIQQNAEIVTCPAIHLFLQNLTRRKPHLYRHIIYWAQLLFFGSLVAIAAIFVTMQPNDWPLTNEDPLSLPNYEDNPRFYFAIFLSPFAVLISILFMKFDLGPVRPSPQSASVFLFACRRRQSNATWWQFFNFVKLVNIDAILERVVTRWVMTAMLLILLSFGILLFYDSSDFSQLIGITLTTIMPLIPRLAQTATPVIVEFERGYLKERVNEILNALDTEIDHIDSKTAQARPTSLTAAALIPISPPEGPSDDSSDAEADPQLFIQDVPPASLEPPGSDDDQILIETVSELPPVSKNNPPDNSQYTNLQSTSDFPSAPKWWRRAPGRAILGATEVSHEFIKKEYIQIRNILTLNMVHQSVCLFTAIIVGLAQYFILWGFDDRTLNLTSNLKFVFWAVVLGLAALNFFRGLLPVSVRGKKRDGMYRLEWVGTAILVIAIQTIAILAADAMTIFAWSMISYAVVYPSPGLPALGFFLAIVSSFLILSNELSDPFLLIRILVRDAGRLLPEPF